jgi:hypothetical protein
MPLEIIESSSQLLVVCDQFCLVLITNSKSVLRGGDVCAQFIRKFSYRKGHVNLTPGLLSETTSDIDRLHLNLAIISNCLEHTQMYRHLSLDQFYFLELIHQRVERGFSAAAESLYVSIEWPNRKKGVFAPTPLFIVQLATQIHKL